VNLNQTISALLDEIHLGVVWGYDTNIILRYTSPLQFFGDLQKGGGGVKCLCHQARIFTKLHIKKLKKHTTSPSQLHENSSVPPNALEFIKS